jgi:hypothetical protein
MKEVIVIERCDVCKSDLDSLPDRETSIPVNVGSQKYLVDLCGNCRDKFLAPIRENSRKGKTTTAGKKTRKRTNNTTPAQCEKCSKWFSSKQGLATHLRVTHGIQGGGAAHDHGTVSLMAAEAV